MTEGEGIAQRMECCGRMLLCQDNYVYYDQNIAENLVYEGITLN